MTTQLVQLRKDVERRQQLLSVLNQQVDVVSTHLHNLELVQQGQTAKLPDTDEITADAVKAEEMLAELQADAELTGSLGRTATSGMTEEEKALYDELEREAGAKPQAAELTIEQSVEPAPVHHEPIKTVSPEPTASAPPRQREAEAG